MACQIALVREKPLIRWAGRPVGRYLRAFHPPYFLGIGLEEYLEQAGAEAAGYPLLERFGFRRGVRLYLEIRQHAANRFEGAELEERIKGPDRIFEQLAAIIDARFARTVEKIAAQKLRPQCIHFR
jgi:hypothetical protein